MTYISHKNKQCHAYHLDESLIIEILSWLPSKSLLRFKSVSKSWYAIIKSRYFIYKHVNHNKERHADCLLVQYSVTQANELESHMLWLDDTNDEDRDMHVLDMLLRQPPYNYYLYGPCNGIYFCSSGEWFHSDWDRILWSPTLDEEKQLPPMIRKPNMSLDVTCYKEHCGFGFDPVTEDYKVVIIIGYENSKKYLDLNRPSSVMVYSLRKDSWSYVGDLSKSYYVQEHSCYAFANTSVYWLGTRDGEYSALFKYDVIIVVDLVTEKSREIGLPEMRIKGPMTWCLYSECLMVYNGSIALVALYKKEYNLDIWTLNKDTSWSKELTVKLDCSIRRPLGHYCVDNNMLLLESEDNYKVLLLYELDSNQLWYIVDDDVDDCYFSCKTVSLYGESYTY